MFAKFPVKVFFVLLFVNFIFAAPNYAQNAVTVTNEKFAYDALEKLHAAEATYLSVANSWNFGTLSQLREAGYIDAALASGEKYGYNFTLTVVPRGPKQAPAYQVSAVPRLYAKSGKRSFYLDQTGMIRGADRGGAPATATDPLVPPICGESKIVPIMFGLNSSEATYFATMGANINYGTPAQLASAYLIDSYLATGEKCGYRFTIVIISAVPAAGVPASYWIRAVPVQYGMSGFRSYYTDQTGIIRGADLGGAPAGADDPPVQF